MEHQIYRARVHKFSGKPPGHEAARQRENQRRHRARVKSRITDLEAALANTQTRLNEALRQIEMLTAEVKRLRAVQSSDDTRAVPLPPATSPQGHILESARVSTQCGTADEVGGYRLRQGSPNCASHHETDGLLLPTPCNTSGSPCQSAVAATPETINRAGTQFTANPRADTEPTPGFEDPNSDCPLLPPPEAGESTIPCRDAYTIIKERSSPEFDLDAARKWLKPGFRRAIVPGTGCRVQTHILFAFVDRMTPI